MTQAFVHLSDLYGDDQDQLGLRGAFAATVEAQMHQGERVLVVDVSPEKSSSQWERYESQEDIELRALRDVDWSDKSLVEVNVDLSGADVQSIEGIDRVLTDSGFVRAGRPWGEAGSSTRYVIPGGARDRLTLLKSQTRVAIGASWVTFRDRWLTPELRSRFIGRVRARVSRSLSPADLLDDGLHKLPPPEPIHDADLLPGSNAVPGYEWSVSFDEESNPWDLAQECFDQHGLWPISFSYPGNPMSINSHPTQIVADIVPGFPYSFDDELSYMGAYHQAYMGLTKRKAGWDCFRHVEILAAGCIPLMPDVASIPTFSMVHYPKSAMAQAAKHMRHGGGIPNPDARRAFRKHFEVNLTSVSMARYLLRAAGLSNAQRILFVDAALPQAADYQSVVTLLGLKQLRGSECHVRHPVEYVYSDTQERTSQLYGRGFGYTRLLAPELRSSTEHDGTSPNPADFDALVVGSVSRNSKQARALLQQFAPERTVWIHGEDTPPTLDQTRSMKDTGAHIFVRSIHTNRR